MQPAQTHLTSSKPDEIRARIDEYRVNYTERQKEFETVTNRIDESIAERSTFATSIRANGLLLVDIGLFAIALLAALLSGYSLSPLLDIKSNLTGEITDLEAGLGAGAFGALGLAAWIARRALLKRQSER